MTNPETPACRTTQHCAFHGWCRRCDPAFAAVMSRVNVAIQRTDADDTHWGPLYAAVAEALRPAAVSVPPPAPRADDQAALRDRIAAAIRAFDFSDYGMDDVSYALEADPDAQEWVPSLADAVLAVLPPTADRAAVIAATARACAEHLRDTYSDMWTADAARSLELHAARIERGEPTALLRRMADEAAVSGPCVVGEQQNETPEAEAGCAHCGGDHSWDDCEAYTALVSGEQPSTDKEPEPGDRVRVTYEGTWLADDDPRTLLVGNHSGDVWRNIAPDHARVEVLPAAEVPE